MRFFFSTNTTSSLPTIFFLPGTASGFWNPKVPFAFQKLTAVPFAKPGFFEDLYAFCPVA